MIKYIMFTLTLFFITIGNHLKAATGLLGQAGSMIEMNSCSVAGYQTIFQFCYDSAFPLRIMGQTVISGSDIQAPPGVTRQSFCKCGKFFYGYTRGMWVPTRIVEVVRKANCSPVYGMMVKPALTAMATVSGTLGTTMMTAGDSMKPYETGFRHYHSWKFPARMFYGHIPRCWHQGSFETSITSLTWSRKDPVLMNLLYPEWGIIGAVTGSSLFDVPAHTASCIANTTGVGLLLDDYAYWLGGCMGNNLPAAGSYSSEKNSVIGTSTILNRSIMHSNRRFGYASVSNVGDKALCGAVPVPYPAKSEFKATMLFPYSEGYSRSLSVSGAANSAMAGGMVQQSVGLVSDFLGITSRCAHRLGSSQLRWGLNRSDQALNPNDSDAVYLLWRWVDCCELGI